MDTDTTLSSDSDSKFASQHAVKTYIIAYLLSLAPSGLILMWGNASAPTNWLLCDGSAVSRTTYSALFAIVGITYGAGDASTTFNLPDMRQRFPLGKAASGTGSTLGGTGGTVDHIHTVLPASLASISLVGIGTGADDVTVNTSAANPPFQTVNFIIKI